MTQTVLPATAAPPDVGVRTRSRRLAGPRAALATWLEGSPGRLRLVAILTVIAALLLALGGGEALRLRSSALDDAAKASGHLVLLQKGETELQEVDADATNSFLSFGLEPRAQRLDYLTTLNRASEDLATASDYSPADAEALGTATAALTRYAGFIGEARANNRQGLQVGASYLNEASSLMTWHILPPLRARADADQKAVDSAYSRAGNARWLLLGFAVFGLAGLLGAQYYLALRSRRFLNLPLVGATAVVLVALIIGAATMAFAQAHADSVRNGALARATDVSTARLDAFDAKSLESLTLVNRGSATSDDTAWKAKIAEAKKLLPGGYTAAATALAAYTTQHAKINAADVNGDWERAVSLAVATGSGSANAEFATFAAQTAKAPQEQVAEATSGLHTARIALLPAGLLIVLAGLLAAVGAWWGVSLRVDEYR